MKIYTFLSMLIIRENSSPKSLCPSEVILVYEGQYISPVKGNK